MTFLFCEYIKLYPLTFKTYFTFGFIYFADAIGTNSVLLKILEPLNDCICTKFKGNTSDVCIQR